MPEAKGGKELALQRDHISPIARAPEAMSRAPRIAVVTLCLGIHFAPANAAPTTTESGAASDDTAPSAARPLREVATPSAGDQMLDRLIQLQPRTAGIEVKEPRPQAPASLAKTALPPAVPTSLKPAPPPQQTGQLFGAGVLRKPAAHAESTAVEPPWKQRELANTRPSAAGKPGGEGAPPRLFLLPRELIFFIRENREWVIGGSLSALALFWAGTTAFTRRRSRAPG